MPNTVELLGSYGGDETHALSAWTSTSRDLTEDKRARIDRLLLKLATDGHNTPFETSALHFLVTCEQASHIHMLKHRIGVSINGESARYKEFTEDRWYVPADWPREWSEILDVNSQNQFLLYHKCIESLVNEYGFSRKRAKESARFFLPYSSQLTLDIMFNFKSFVHFQQLRNDDHAQDEIHDIAQQMLDLARGTGQFDLSLEAFGL